MPLLMPCPRCTQALPVKAGFCRRCGLNVGGVGRAVATPPGAGGKTWKLGILAVLGTTTFLMVGIAGVFYAANSDVGTMPTAVQASQSTPTQGANGDPVTAAQPSDADPVAVTNGTVLVPAQRFDPQAISTPPGYAPTRKFAPGYSGGIPNPDGARHSHTERGAGHW